MEGTCIFYILFLTIIVMTKFKLVYVIINYYKCVIIIVHNLI